MAFKEIHLPCPSCPSSDAYCINEDGSGYCFSCKSYFKGDYVVDEKYTYEFVTWRSVSKDTFAFYGAKTRVSSDGEPISIGFPYPEVGAKVRNRHAKEFHWEGEHKSGLFGRDKFESGKHRFVTITEGELDACSLYQVLKTPVVSVQSAASAARDAAADRSWLNSFERIYLAFDNDTAGNEAARNVAKLFDFSRIYQVKFTKHKDANEYLQAGEEADLKGLWWASKKYMPEDIVSSLADFKKILEQETAPGIPYPFPTLNEMTYGIRTSETVLITAQEGVGKTSLMHALEYQLLKETKDVGIGAIYLEEPKRRHLEALAGLELGNPVHLPDTPYSTDEKYAAVERLVGKDDRLFVYSHFGSDDPEHLIDTIRFLVTACNCRYVMLDHITMAVSGLAGEDERRALDYISTRLEMMVHELDFSLIIVSHVNDEGQTRGSRYISKIAHLRIDLKRDLLSVDPVEKFIIYVSVSKNRFCHKTGMAGRIIFDPVTYRYREQLAEDASKELAHVADSPPLQPDTPTTESNIGSPDGHIRGAKELADR